MGNDMGTTKERVLSLIIVTVGGNPTPVWTALCFHLETKLMPCRLVHTEDTRAVAKRLAAELRARRGWRDLSVKLVKIDPLAPDAGLIPALDDIASQLGLDDAVDVSGGTKLMAARVADWARGRGLPDDRLTTVPEPGWIQRPFAGQFGGGEERVDAAMTVEGLARLHCDGRIVAFGLPAALADDERRRAAAIYFAGRISALMRAPGGTTGSDGTHDHVPSVPEVGPDEQYWNKALSPPAQRSRRAGNEWFELAVLLALVEDGGYDDLRIGVAAGPADARRCQVDVVATKAGRLWAFSATTSEVGDATGLTEAGWYKATEAVVRARQLGGDDSQAVVVATQPDTKLKWARHEVEQVFRGQHPPILVGGDRVVGALKRVAALLPEPRSRSSRVGQPTPPPLGEPIDLIIAVGDNPMPVAEAIEAHDARSTLLLVSDRTWRVSKKLTSRPADGRRLYVQPVRDPYNASSVQDELVASGVQARAVDLTGGTKPMILGLWRWASERSTAVEVTYVPAGSPEMVGVGSSPSRPLPTLPFDDIVQPLSNLSTFELTPAAARTSPGLGLLHTWWGPATGGWAEPVSVGDRVGLWRLFAPEQDRFWLLMLGLHGRQWIVGDVTSLGEAHADEKKQIRSNIVRRAVIALDCLAADTLGSAAVPVVIGDPAVVGTMIGHAGDATAREKRADFLARLRDEWCSPRQAQVLCPQDLDDLGDPGSAQSRHLAQILGALPREKPDGPGAVR